MLSDWAWLLGVGGTAGAAVCNGIYRQLVSERRRKIQVESARTEFAKRLGLTYSAGTWTAAPKLEGVVHESRVLVSWRGRDKSEAAETTYTIDGFPKSLVLQRKSWKTEIEKTVGSPSRSTGDPAFDNVVVLRGDELDEMTFADPVARATAIVVVEGGFKLSGGIATLGTGGHDPPETIEPRIFALSTLARTVRRAREGLPKLLLSRVQEFAEPRALEILRRHFYGSGEEIHAMALARVSLNPELRVVAAVATGDRLAALEVICDLSASRIGRAMAVGMLVEFQFDLEEGLAKGAALSPNSEFLNKPLQEVRELIEASCLDLLSSSDHYHRLFGIFGLGHFGSIEVVPPLVELSKRVVLNSALAKAAQKAVRQIQARQPGADAGQLSMSQPSEEGALSEASGGEVSLASKTKG